MRAIVYTIAAAIFALTVPAHANDLLAHARASFAKRDYSPAGLQQAQEAADTYSKLADEAADEMARARFSIAMSEALYFVGNASESNPVKVEKHMKGHEVADRAVSVLCSCTIAKLTAAEVANLKTSLPAEQLALLADGLYYRGVNLGQWGAANGVIESLSRWPELRRNMELIDELGQAAVHEYGAYRTLGRGFHKIPRMLGGSLLKAADYLGRAVAGSKPEGQVYSTNGYNNVYYAEVLIALGQKAEAATLLEAFLKAAPETLNKDLEPENRYAKLEAQKLLEGGVQ